MPPWRRQDATLPHPTFCPIAIAFLLQIATEPHAYPSPTLLHTRMYNRERLGIAAKVITPPHCSAMPHVPFAIAVVIPCLLATALPLPLQKPQTKPGPDQPHQEPGEVYLAGLPGRLVRTLVQLVGYEMCSALTPLQMGEAYVTSTFVLVTVASSMLAWWKHWCTVPHRRIFHACVVDASVSMSLPS